MHPAHHLITAPELAALAGAVTLDCRFDLADTTRGRRLYGQGHIPGAVFADLDLDLTGRVSAHSGRHPLPDPQALSARLGAWGIGPDTPVAVYDDLGGAFAARAWWLLRWLGHERVQLLDGGLQAWTHAGLPLSQEIPERRARDFPCNPAAGSWIDTADLVTALARDAIQVVDARAPARFRGEHEPIDPVAGHIPGAINLPLTDNLDSAGRFLAPERLRERFAAALGERPPGEIAHSCGSGVNACHNLLAMEIAGLGGSRLYAGSWSEWIRDPERPVATGG